MLRMTMNWRTLEIVEVDAIDMLARQLDRLLLQLIVSHFVSVIRECGEDLWRLIVLMQMKMEERN